MRHCFLYNILLSNTGFATPMMLILLMAYYEKFEDTKGGINRKRTDNVMADSKRTNSDVQNTTQKPRLSNTNPIKVESCPQVPSEK